MENHLKLTGFEPIGFNNNKKQIILCETKRYVIDYVNSLKYRYNNKNPFIPNYIVKKSGEILQVLEPEGYSKFLEIENIDHNAIIICLENLGWLKKNTLDDSYSNWIGDIYRKKVFEKKWRDYFFWDKYEEEQVKSVSQLILKLCDKFNIPKKSIGSNVKMDGSEFFEGIITRSNLETNHKDVNPSFDFKLLKKNIGDV
jgi:N-acetyl-anhydromuramyl-L-alanine amidase AmpD